MSEGMPCNRCSLDQIEWKYRDKTVEVVASPEAGWPKAVEVLVDGKFVAWFAELTDACAC